MEIDPGAFGSYALRLLVAAVIGGVVGIEREIRGKPAGMRTNILMCVGSCLVMILSVEVARASGFPADPGRIAAQVVTGVGFIGAGMILRSRVSVTGLTSAATIWFVSAIGLVVGYGGYLLAVVATALMVVTLTALKRAERRIEARRQIHIVRLLVTRDNLALVRNVLVENRVTPEEVELKRLDEGIRFDIEYVAIERKHVALIEALQDLDGVEIVHHY